MRIVVNGWFWNQLAAGSGQYLAGLATWLPQVASGCDLILVQPAHPHAPPETGLPPGWRVVRAPVPAARLGRNLAKVWFEQITFPHTCRQLRADVALVPYWGSPAWRPCPVAVTVHDIIPLLLPPYRGGFAQRLYTQLVSWTARRAAVVLTDSEASRRDIVAHLRISAGRVKTVHLAVAPEYRPVTDRDELARVGSRYQLPSGPFWLYLGGFDVRKNVRRLLRAYARALAQAGEAPFPRLVVAGKLPDVDTAFAPDPRLVVAELGLGDHVHFTGWIDEADKPALYSLAAATLFVSEYEGFGLPVLEAQACGCPVITG